MFVPIMITAGDDRRGNCDVKDPELNRGDRVGHDEDGGVLVTVRFDESDLLRDDEYDDTASPPSLGMELGQASQLSSRPSPSLSSSSSPAPHVNEENGDDEDDASHRHHRRKRRRGSGVEVEVGADVAVTVRSVAPASPAARRGVRAGMVFVSVNGEPVSDDASEVASTIRSALTTLILQRSADGGGTRRKDDGPEASSASASAPNWLEFVFRDPAGGDPHPPSGAATPPPATPAAAGDGVGSRGVSASPTEVVAGDEAGNDRGKVDDPPPSPPKVAGDEDGNASEGVVTKTEERATDVNCADEVGDVATSRRPASVELEASPVGSEQPRSNGCCGPTDGRDLGGGIDIGGRDEAGRRGPEVVPSCRTVGVGTAVASAPSTPVAENGRGGIGVHGGGGGGSERDECRRLEAVVSSSAAPVGTTAVLGPATVSKPGSNVFGRTDGPGGGDGGVGGDGSDGGGNCRQPDAVSSSGAGRVGTTVQPARSAAVTAAAVPGGNGRRKTVVVRFDRSDLFDKSEQERPGSLGMVLGRAIHDDVARIVVASVTPESPADRRGVKGGFLVVRVGNRRVEGTKVAGSENGVSIVGAMIRSAVCDMALDLGFFSSSLEMTFRDPGPSVRSELTAPFPEGGRGDGTIGTVTPGNGNGGEAHPSSSKRHEDGATVPSTRHGGAPESVGVGPITTVGAALRHWQLTTMPGMLVPAAAQEPGPGPPTMMMQRQFFHPWQQWQNPAHAQGFPVHYGQNYPPFSFSEQPPTPAIGNLPSTARGPSPHRPADETMRQPRETTPEGAGDDDDDLGRREVEFSTDRKLGMMMEPMFATGEGPQKSSVAVGCRIVGFTDSGGGRSQAYETGRVRRGDVVAEVNGRDVLTDPFGDIVASLRLSPSSSSAAPSASEEAEDEGDPPPVLSNGGNGAARRKCITVTFVHSEQIWLKHWEEV